MTTIFNMDTPLPGGTVEITATFFVSVEEGETASEALAAYMADNDISGAFEAVAFESEGN